MIIGIKHERKNGGMYFTILTVVNVQKTESMQVPVQGKEEDRVLESIHPSETCDKDR